MKCKNCGCEMNENDLFCAECGAKNENNEVEVKTETREYNRSNGNMKKIIAVVVVVGIIAAIIAAIMSANAKTYNFESSELGEIILSENYEKYEGDTLIVHGFFYEHPTEKSVYVLAKDLNDENPVYFTTDSIDEELGDGSEITITGFLSKMNESSSVTVVYAQDIEVIKKEEKIISYACVDDLIKDSSNAVNKKVTLSGIITCVSDEDAVIDDAGAPTEGYFVRLDRGTAVKDFRELSFGLYNATGILSLTSYGDLILTLENVKLIEEREIPLPVSSPEELYNNPVTYDGELIVVEGWIEGAGSELYILASGNIKIELSGIKEEDRVGLTGGYSKITGIFRAYGGKNDCDLIEVEKIGN